MSRRALMAPELEAAARPCLNPASILWPAWPAEAPAVGPQPTARTRRLERERPLWFFNAPELNRPAEGEGD